MKIPLGLVPNSFSDHFPSFVHGIKMDGKGFCTYRGSIRSSSDTEEGQSVAHVPSRISDDDRDAVKSRAQSSCRHLVGYGVDACALVILKVHPTADRLGVYHELTPGKTMESMELSFEFLNGFVLSIQPHSDASPLEQGQPQTIISTVTLPTGQGQIDQLEDRDIRNVEAAGSNPALSTQILASSI